jgi:uncharacterized protein YjbI with pentapeptide repeats
MDRQVLDKILEGHRKFLNGEEGGERASFSGLRLPGVDWSGLNLQGADLRNAILSAAFLYGANLTGAQIKGADLSLYHVDMVYIDGANMPDGKLYGRSKKRKGRKK